MHTSVLFYYKQIKYQLYRGICKNNIAFSSLFISVVSHSSLSCFALSHPTHCPVHHVGFNTDGS